MRKFTALALGASIMVMASPASAATFFFSSGNYSGPSPLLSPDILEITGNSNKTFFSNFTNQSGTVNWRDGTLFVGGGSQISNQSVWNVYGDNVFAATTGSGTFNNSGFFNKLGGSGDTNFGIAFINSGTVNADVGRILFSSSSSIFNGGSSFTGAGDIAVTGSATFNNGFTSQNLDFIGSSYTGNAAVLGGSADWYGGNFSGDWTIDSGATLTALGGANRVIQGGTFTNNGTIDWAEDSVVFLGGNVQVTNNNAMNFMANSTFTTTTGGGTLINAASGLMMVDAGKTVNISSGFISNGGTMTANGILNFSGSNQQFNAGSTFNGSGDNRIVNSAGFAGDIASTNLDFIGSSYTGNAAVLSGSADWYGGNFSGGWTIDSGATLTALGGANRNIQGGTFTNNGTIDWAEDSAVFLGGNVQVTNNNAMNFMANSTFTITTGGGTLINAASGLMTIDAGKTVNIASGFISNGGTMTANGTLNFNNSSQQFNTGSLFNGSGDNRIINSAGFAGNITSTNLDFVGSNYTGNAAVLGGSADWYGGNFVGDWTIDSGATLTGLGGANRTIQGGVFTNDGTINWAESSNVFIGGGAQVINNGVIDLMADSIFLTPTTGGGSFVNNGLIEKTGGSGTTNLATSIGFDNEGTVNVLSGTIALPTSFANDGTLGGTGTFSLTGTLTNNGDIAPGASGATGTLSLTGNYVQTLQGSLNAQLASAAMFDMFDITGAAQLGGTLALSCILGCSINNGDSFVLLDSAGPLTGVFDTVTTQGFLNGFTYDLVYDYDADLVRLTVLDVGMMAGVPEPTTWAMLVLGFGLIGGSMRRSRRIGGVKLATVPA